MNIQIDINPVVNSIGNDHFDVEVSIRYGEFNTNRIIESNVFMRPVAMMKATSAVTNLEKIINLEVSRIINGCLHDFCSKYKEAKE